VSTHEEGSNCVVTRNAKLISLRRDKAVQDNIIESWSCVDCGVNTAPRCKSGPKTRAELAAKGWCTNAYDWKTEIYHVDDAVWKRAGMREWNGCLCVGCIERRIGRRLRPRDDAETWADLPSTKRVAQRRGKKWSGRRIVTQTVTLCHVMDWSVKKRAERRGRRTRSRVS
jgi:hypothetical protein